VLPYHQLKLVDDPAFAPAGRKAFSIYTVRLSTEFNNTVPEYAGSIGASEATDTRHEVVVEVDGKRLAVSSFRLAPADLSLNSQASRARALQDSTRVRRGRQRCRLANAGNGRQGRGCTKVMRSSRVKQSLFSKQ